MAKLTLMGENEEIMCGNVKQRIIEMSANEGSNNGTS
jgi:hypothetical protein